MGKFRSVRFVLRPVPSACPGKAALNSPKAFVSLFKGENFGKMLVRICPEPTVR